MTQPLWTEFHGNNFTCPLTGNPDLYGLGIRLGMYFQMVTIQLSGLLSYALGSEDVTAEAAVVFVVSVGTVLVRSIVNRSVAAVEVVPIMTLLIAQVNSYRNVNSLKTLAQVVYAAELLGLIGLAVWFWWYGMDTLFRGCYDKTFFFAKVSIWHWFRTFNKVLTVFSALGGLLYAGVFLIGFSWLAAMNILKFFRFMRGDVEPLEIGRTSVTNAEFSGVEFLVNIGVIVFVEMTLKWNHITEVHSLNTPGQFMPFFIGLAQLLAVVYKGVSNGLKRMANEDEPESLQYESDLDCEHDKGLRRRGHYSPAWPGTGDDVELSNVQR